MRKLLLTVLILFPAMNYSHAQDLVMLKTPDNPVNDINADSPKIMFEFIAFPQTDELRQVSDELIDRHFLGEEIARKMYLLNKNYGHQEAVAPGNSATKTIVRKPVIFNSVKRIERDLKKNVKSGEITEEKARIEFSKVLDVVLNIVNANTEDFEKRLNAIADPDKLLDVYLNEVELNYVN